MSSATFSLTDLSSQAARVLEAVRRFGKVDVETEQGEKLELRPKAAQPSIEEIRSRFEEHRQRLRQLGHEPVRLNPEELERFNKIIAGEI